MRILAASISFALCLVASVAITKQQPAKRQIVDMSKGDQRIPYVAPLPSTPRIVDMIKGDQRTPPVAPLPSTLQMLPGGETVGLTPTGTSFRSYGFYDPFTGAAVENDVWTFDHGATDPLEGWVSKDITDNAFTAFRRITPGIWSGHDNVPAAPVIAGTSSLWLGWFEDEADSACWTGGLGYGNLWRQQITSDRFFSGTGNDALEFDYFLNIESGYDFLRVIAVDTLGYQLNLVGTFTGIAGTPGASVHFNQPVGVTTGMIYRIRFEFISDGAFSDEDGFYPTTVGAFGVDDITLSGGSVQLGATPLSVDFESGLQGYVAEVIPPIGAQVGTVLASSYSYDPSCGVSANGLTGYVLEFHDGTDQHPGLQNERLSSPAVPVSAYGSTPLNVIVEMNNYIDMPGTDLFWRWHFSYYPYICPATGQPIWSSLQSAPFILHTTSPVCSPLRVFANDTTGSGGWWGTSSMDVQGPGTVLIPDGVDSVRFHVDVFSNAETATGNFSPLYDNIRIIVSDRSTMHHVPSPAFPYIQAAIDAADPGDTVMVAAGEYTGAGNRNLNFDGKDIVLMSEDGPDVTIINIENAGRGIGFLNGETSAAKVDGFTFRHGRITDDVGGGIGILDSDPTIVNCIVDSCTARDTGLQAGNGGGVWVANSLSTFTNCEFRYNSAENPGTFGQLNGCGGGVYVYSGSPTFTDCVIEHNSSQGANNYIGIGGMGAGGGVYVLWGATATFVRCEIAFNTSTVVGNLWEEEANGGGVMAWGTVLMTDCPIHDNTSGQDGGGLACYDSTGAGVLTGCEIYNNGASDGAGVYATQGISLVGCDIYGNTAINYGGGAWIGGAVTTDDCDIRDNTADWGGGVYFGSSGGNVGSTRIQANTATGQGGGILALYAATVDGCWITGNYAAGNGGGALATALAGLTMTSCTVAGNRTDANGGGICVTSSGDADLTQTIVWGNEAAVTGREGYVVGAGVLTFDCSLTDSFEVLGSGTVTYVANNVFWDPLFCGPEPAASAPTTAGDYGIAANSHATQFNSGCGASMGADTIGCPWGAVTSIADVGNDQGRFVRIQWNRAMWDVYGASDPITQYSVWRRVEEGLSSPAIANVPRDPADGIATGLALDACRTAMVATAGRQEPTDAKAAPSLGFFAPPGIWDFVILVPASAQSSYSTVVPTLCDSTASFGQCYSTFFVRAHTGTPALVFDSPPNSGYSLDNLAPGVPQTFAVAYNTGSGNQLYWDPSPEPDFQYYRIYRGSDESFTPDSTNVVHETATPEWSDPDYDGWNVYYKVTAVDYAGNESGPASAGTVTATTEPVLPETFSLYQNVPNPFNPTTVIRYDVPGSGGHVTLRIYNVSGQLVRTLINGTETAGRKTVTWSGRNDHGHSVATGVYFYRMTAPGFERTRKMLLMK